MGNLPAREVDLLEFFLRDPNERFNVSSCLNSTKSVNDTLNTAWENCLSKHVPGDIITRPYSLPWEQQVVWIVLFGVMIIIAVIGNAMVMWIILAHRRMRTVTNYFLLNLSIADFMLASGNATFNFVFMLENHWPFGGTFCVVSSFVANLTVSTSVFTIFAMSIDRYGFNIIYIFYICSTPITLYEFNLM